MKTPDSTLLHGFFLGIMFATGMLSSAYRFMDLKPTFWVAMGIGMTTIAAWMIAKRWLWKEKE